LSVVELPVFTVQHKGMRKIKVKVKQEVFRV